MFSISYSLVLRCLLPCYCSLLLAAAHLDLYAEGARAAAGSVPGTGEWRDNRLCLGCISGNSSFNACDVLPIHSVLGYNYPTPFHVPFAGLLPSSTDAHKTVSSYIGGVRLLMDQQAHVVGVEALKMVSRRSGCDTWCSPCHGQD